MEYAYCPKCSNRYNVSRLRDKSKVFICEDCVRKDLSKMLGIPHVPVYIEKDMARVKN